MNELKIMNIKGIDCYEKDGVAYLDLETCARGLGFTEIAASGNECVKWSRVRKYLGDLHFIDTSVDGAELPKYIPENVFYRLAMKAKNAVAEAFQAKIADEVIPSIRKHGLYATESTVEAMLNDPDVAIQLLQKVKEERAKRKALEARAEADRPKVLFADSVTASKSSILVGEMAKLLTITRRVMLDMGNTPVEIGAVARGLYETCGVPLHESFSSQIPGQLCLYTGTALDE